ncbi:hypothetical protein HYO65_gp057 [Tenacibaculum phage PTm1]|uniref:Uncharacterized protein n=2 Tax=Shirahamavirus PTm1 TaxID=2846435 RepID=A0A5S9ERR3_9CAUD|nr:hypothetical protein HYO65_gp057 [Tenacibaculum phage PTm1]BBI90449.1 hypothetical protein [Tenacibaculum phage PTm1]BBI90757.1 hypothetical protein [Tenacibaculum phage PTm5]
MKYTKQRRQVNRLLKNQTKSTILCLKKYCNNSNKKLLKQIKRVMKKYISPYYTVALFLIVLYNLLTLPNKLHKMIYPTLNVEKSMGSVQCPKTTNVADNLVKKTNFTYFKGKTIEAGNKFEDVFSFTPKYPREFQENGYLTRCKSEQGGAYFIWSNFKPIKGHALDGWFLAVNGVLQLEYGSDEYVPLLVPVVERKYKTKIN